MKSNRRLVLISVFLLSFCTCQDPQSQVVPESGGEGPNASEQNRKLARTIKLGNIWESPAEGEWGVPLEANFFPVIQSAGFTAIRLPVRWSAHAMLDSPYSLDADFLQRVDWALDQALGNNLSVVFDIHHYEEMFLDPLGEKQRLLGLWTNLAVAVQDRPSDVIFELFNEPHGDFTTGLWNESLREGVQRIREIDPYRTLMVGTADWGGAGGLEDLVLPADSNLIVTIHYYEPFQFTHQGTEWNSGSEDWLGTTWNGSAAELEALDEQFDRIQSWASTHGVPIFVGEFGSYHRAAMSSRLAWTHAVVEACEARGFSWGYWEFCAGFGAYDLGTGTWNELLGAMIPGN